MSGPGLALAQKARQALMEKRENWKQGDGVAEEPEFLSQGLCLVTSSWPWVCPQQVKFVYLY